MSQSLRVSVCSNCGHVLVRAASCSGNATRNRTIQYSSRRAVSWGSLFGHLRGKAATKEPQTSAKLPDDEARKRTEAAVRRLREIKDRAGRPPPPIPPSIETSSPLPPQSSPPPPRPTPSQRLPEELFMRGSSIGKQDETFPLYLNLKPPPPASGGTKPRKISQLADRIEDNDVLFPKSRSYNPFLSPLQAERMAAMRKYLQMARTDTNAKKEPIDRGPYPWEEATPVPWDTEADKLGGLRRLLDMRAPELSRKRVEKKFSGRYLRKAIEVQSRQESPPVLNLDIADEATDLESSKLYLHLRDHHIRTMTSYHGPGSEDVEAADRELFHRVNLATQALKEQYPGKLWAAKFRDWFHGTATFANKTVTPFIKYILAKEGFEPTWCQISQQPINHVYYDLGHINQNALAEMIDEVYRKTVAPMHPGLIKHVIKRLQDFPNTPPRKDVKSSKSTMFVTHGQCTPVSTDAFQWHGIVISLESGRILYQSKEWIQLWTMDRTELIQPNKVAGDFLRIMNDMRISSWRRKEGIKSITRHYDF